MFTIPTDIFVALYKNKEENMTITDITKSVNCTFSYAHNIIQYFQLRGWVKLVKSGRIVNCSLTSKGKRIADLVVMLKKICD